MITLIAIVVLAFITLLAYVSKTDSDASIRVDHNSKLSDSERSSLETTSANNNQSRFRFNFMQRYPEAFKCNFNYTSFERGMPKTAHDYSKPAPESAHTLRISRAVLVYFPVENSQHFEIEFRWLYRSWLEMQKTEPATWRTDIVVFINKDGEQFANKPDFFFNHLNCSFNNVRKAASDEPMCSLVDYKPLKIRNLSTAKTANVKTFDSNAARYAHLLETLDIFSDEPDNLLPFYTFVREQISSYGYLDSILMAFDGYARLKASGYNYVIRSDMDVFLTPLFAKWLPRFCNDFCVGRGGYSTQFNVKRLGRIAHDLNFEYAAEENLGSTWYSSVEQFRLVSYLTLFGMSYVAVEEFSPPEREGKLGVMLWPYWHYGVLLLYGQNLVMNHLIATSQLNIVKLLDQLDYPSTYSGNVNQVPIHLHVFHSDDMFSKFSFKAGKYDAMSVRDDQVSITKYYALKMALEAKRLTCKELSQQLTNDISKKKS